MSTALQIRHAMADFIDKQLAEKLEKEKDKNKRRGLREKHQPAAWIDDAARRINRNSITTRLRLATHAIKYSHPHARGSSLYCDGCEVAGENLVASHILGKKMPLDVVGNAASLDVYKFLSLEVDGVPLWRRARDQDAALLAALPGSPEENQVWVETFATLAQNDPKPMSHPLAKQVYWPLGENDYHLLQPLFPTSLVQRFSDILRKARFSDETKAAREAKRSKKPHAHGYRDWPNLLIQKFGGTKPHNISQLNSERHGEAWLLPSVPPQWESKGLRPPLIVDTVFKRLPHELSRKAEELGCYLVSVRNWSNKDIRDGRAYRVSAIIDELIEYAMRIQSLEAGWSANENCKLSDAECCWLDPYRDDGDFQQQCSSTDWPRDIADRFGKWLNSRLLEHYKLAVGDPEHNEWQREFKEELADHLRGVKNV
ncbi:MAG: type I-F CRISPR-associated protein Csy1 [Gammaproteobacteria bacterium]|nr:type I-F CRISPR-associated protein Csy1 [Gammaproteobacteria bacterium]